MVKLLHQSMMGKQNIIGYFNEPQFITFRS